ncbi:hypothetical protein [Dietzia sp. JS16-p6b]|uniref:hypothetical protein n=1 Tax=Dietzia sp. JS16-p6b TaxID=2052657 RepID=UPI001F1E5F82|nr:hypothetical protein [Dietzia sp. JS16-p6b]
MAITSTAHHPSRTRRRASARDWTTTIATNHVTVPSAGARSAGAYRMAVRTAAAMTTATVTASRASRATGRRNPSLVRRASHQAPGAVSWSVRMTDIFSYRAVSS